MAGAPETCPASGRDEGVASTVVESHRRPPVESHRGLGVFTEDPGVRELTFFGVDRWRREQHFRRGEEHTGGGSSSTPVQSITTCRDGVVVCGDFLSPPKHFSCGQPSARLVLLASKGCFLSTPPQAPRGSNLPTPPSVPTVLILSLTDAPTVVVAPLTDVVVFSHNVSPRSPRSAPNGPPPVSHTTPPPRPHDVAVPPPPSVLPVDSPPGVVLSSPLTSRTPAVAHPYD